MSPLSQESPMRGSVVFAALIACLFSGAAYAEEAVATPPVNPKEKNSLAIGLIIGSDLKERFGGEVELDTVIKGLREAFSDKQSMTPVEVQEAFKNIQMEQMKKHTDSMKKLSEEAKSKGEEFLAANKKKEGVQSTASGLQYK